MPLTLRSFIDLVFTIYYWLLIARIILPLLRLGPSVSPVLLQIRRIVYMATEPLLAPLRKLLNPIQLGAGAQLDLSPLILMLLLNVVRSLLWRIL